MSLPTDLMVAESLASTRVDVLEAMLHVRSPKRSTRFRYTRNAIIAGGAVVLLTGGALISVALAPDDIVQTTAVCYQHPSLDSFAQESQSGDVPFNPLANCANEYPQGTVLSICTLPDGTAGVFPREGRPADDFCAALGLADWDSD